MWRAEINGPYNIAAIQQYLSNNFARRFRVETQGNYFVIHFNDPLVRSSFAWALEQGLFR